MRGFWRGFILAGLGLLLAGCDLSGLMPTPFQFPTLTPAPSGTVTATPLPSPTGTATPTRVTPAAVGTLLPQAEQAAALGAGELAMLAEWGSGLPQRLAWSPDGAWLAVASSRGLQVFRSGTLDLAHTFLAGELVRCVAFSGDGGLMAAGLDSGEAAVFRLPGGEPLWRAPLAEKPLLSLAISPDESLLAAGAAGGEVSLWQAADGAPQGKLGNLPGAVMQAAFIRDGSALLTWTPRAQPYLWRLKDGKRVEDFYIGANPGGGSASSLSVSADGALLAAAQGQRVRLMRGSNNTTLAVLTGLTSPAHNVAVSSDGSTVAVGAGAEALIWSDQPVSLVGRVALSVPAESARLALSPDGRWLAVLGSRLQIWNISDGLPPITADPVYATDFQLSGFIDIIEGVWWSAASDGSLLSRDLRSGEPLGSAMGLVFRPAAQAHAARGGWSAAARGAQVLVWRSEADGSPTLRFTLSGHKLGVTALAFSPDEQRLASGSVDGTLRIWDLQAGAVSAELEVGKSVGWVAFSPTGAYLAACAQQRIRVWDAAGMNEVDVFDGYSLAFHPKDDLAAAAGFENGEPVVWVRALGRVQPLATLPLRANRLAFSPQGELLAAAGDSLSVYRVPDGSLIARAPLDGPLREVAFLPGGKRVLGAAWDGVL